MVKIFRKLQYYLKIISIFSLFFITEIRKNKRIVIHYLSLKCANVRAFNDNAENFEH